MWSKSPDIKMRTRSTAIHRMQSKMSVAIRKKRVLQQENVQPGINEVSGGEQDEATHEVPGPTTWVSSAILRQ